jgi:hypothetical protein
MLNRFKIMHSKNIVGVFTSPLDTLGGLATQAAFDRRIRAAAELLTSGKWSSEMEKIRGYDAASPQIIRHFGILLTRIEDEQQDKRALKISEKSANDSALKIRGDAKQAYLKQKEAEKNAMLAKPSRHSGTQSIIKRGRMVSNSGRPLDSAEADALRVFAKENGVPLGSLEYDETAGPVIRQ